MSDILKEVKEWLAEPEPDNGAAIVLPVDETIALVSGLVEEVERCYQLLYGGRCVYCGTVVGADLQNQELSDATLRQHILTCTKHPAAKLQKALEDIEQILPMGTTARERQCWEVVQKALGRDQ